MAEDVLRETALEAALEELLFEPAELTYAAATDVDGDGARWHLFPADEPLALGGRRVRSAPLEPTDVQVVAATEAC